MSFPALRLSCSFYVSFFFSSRRRHTRSPRDWSSDVCSSDLGLVGKYVELPDAYLSLVESFKHAGFSFDTDIQINWINSSALDKNLVHKKLSNVDGIVVPGGFGKSGVNGKIEAIRYARENDIPFFGVCLGMQLAIVEFAQNVVHLKEAHSTEIDANTSVPIIDIIEKDNPNYGNNMKLGSYPVKLMDGTKVKSIYKGEDEVEERHRHRYEFNPIYREQLEQKGLVFSAYSNEKTVEAIELNGHPWFVACQYHPHFKSRPTKAHPLISGFIQAVVNKKY